MYRLIATKALSPRLKSRHNTYKLAPPDESFLEFVHRSAFDLMIHAWDRPPAGLPAAQCHRCNQAHRGKLRAG